MTYRPSCCAPSVPLGRGAAAPRREVPAAAGPVRPDLVTIPAGEFLMGSDAGLGYAGDGEGPQRRVRLAAFAIAPCAVTNAKFQDFANETGYVTDAERAGWSFVFHQLVGEESRRHVKGLSSEAWWWLAVAGACWSRPEGSGSGIEDRMDHPVVHVSWHDAKAFCRWSGTRLPTEAEWECAARGGLAGKVYPWGDELLPDGRHRCNIWQGRFPRENLGSDGFVGTAPVMAYEPNGYGLYNMAGNVWEWCEDWFSHNYHCVTRSEAPLYAVPTARRSMRGGSFLCHHSYCNRYRVAARSSNTPDSTASNCGFRVAV